jgi:hypothetical protein
MSPNRLAGGIALLVPTPPDTRARTKRFRLRLIVGLGTSAILFALLSAVFVNRHYRRGTDELVEPLDEHSGGHAIQFPRHQRRPIREAFLSRLSRFLMPILIPDAHCASTAGLR